MPLNLLNNYNKYHSPVVKNTHSRALLRYLIIHKKTSTNQTRPGVAKAQISPKSMGKKIQISWRSALIGAASATATAAVILGKPRDPTFKLISISLTSFKLNLPVVDVELILTVHVTNPNIVPIHYSSSLMSIFYNGSFLGSAEVQPGSQSPWSCQLLELPARLDGLQLAHQAVQFLADVAKREMVLDAVVDIEGVAKVLWWTHGFKVHVDSHIVVDPLFLDVIEQENKSELELSQLSLLGN